MGMGVAFCWYAVGCPTGMGDARFAIHGFFSQQGFQFLDLAKAAGAIDVTVFIDHSNACRIVTPVFKPAQPFEQYWRNQTVGDGSDDSTHDSIPFLYWTLPTRNGGLL